MKNRTIWTKQTINDCFSLKNPKIHVISRWFYLSKTSETFQPSMLLKSISKALFACLRGRGLVLNLILKPLPIGTAKTVLFCELTNQNCWYIFMTDDIWYLYSCCKYQRKTNREKRFKTGKSCSCLCRMQNYVFMDKFVVKTPLVSSTEKKSSHLPVNITAKERARKYWEVNSKFYKYM